jgi:predicted PurR-regulated permease PerM
VQIGQPLYSHFCSFILTYIAKEVSTMVLNKKAQGLSLTVIIVAALALIVLVVLVAVFVGRIGSTTDGIDKASQAELIALQITYGQCGPTASVESGYGLERTAAESDDVKEQATLAFKDEIARCKGFSNDRGVCEAGGCIWD